MIDWACLAELRSVFGRRGKAGIPEPAALSAWVVPVAALGLTGVTVSGGIACHHEASKRSSSAR